MRFQLRPAYVAAPVLFLVCGVPALAQDGTQSDNAAFQREIETKYIFGFTEGSGIGLQGEKEFSISTTANIAKRDGRFWASETKFEYEFTPNQFMQFELGPFVSYHNIKDVTGREDRNELAFGGLFGEMRYLLLDRGPSSPLAVTLSAEPEWKRISGNGGDHVTEFELELKLNADLELIQNRLYLGANLLYEPEAEHNPDEGGGWEHESTAGISGALAYRITPSTVIAGEVWYLRHYDGTWLNTFEGDAVYVGPSLYVKLSRKMFMTAAWNVQVAGHEEDNPGASLNLHEFSRHRAKMKLAIEF
ncbi:MAG TPA: hypothetical protein VFS63_14940 [Pseudolabrys sp.]|jgi:hypothetical protein|nr:hypothetical protein [Pseudolabrys sp.]